MREEYSEGRQTHYWMRRDRTIKSALFSPDGERLLCLHVVKCPSAAHEQFSGNRRSKSRQLSTVCDSRHDPSERRFLEQGRQCLGQVSQKCIKGPVRQKRGEGKRRKVSIIKKIPGQCEDFLRDTENKEEFF